jgi:hypothetical protein
MRYNVREYTTKLLELIDEGCLSSENVLEELLRYLPEGDVAEFFKDTYDYLEE